MCSIHATHLTSEHQLPTLHQCTRCPCLWQPVNQLIQPCRDLCTSYPPWICAPGTHLTSVHQVPTLDLCTRYPPYICTPATHLTSVHQVPTLHLCTRYPPWICAPGTYYDWVDWPCGIPSLPNTSTHHPHRESNPRPSDLESNAQPLVYVYPVNFR